MRLGIYVRVSSEEQKNEGVSISDQCQRGIECQKKYNFDSYEIYDDAGVSGAADIKEKKALLKLIDDIINKKIDAIFFTDVDRLIRSKAQTELLKIKIKEYGVKLFSLNGEIDLKDETQEFIFDFKSLLAVFEIKKTSQRIKRVLETNAKNGKVGGGPLINYGYTKGCENMLIVDEKEALIVRQIYSLYLSGMGAERIADYLNSNKVPTKRHNTKNGRNLTVKGVVKTNFLWRSAVVYRILSNPIYYGCRHFKEITCESPSIITKDEFEKVQKIMPLRKNTKNTTNKYEYLLKGIIKCSCGENMYGRKRENLRDNHYTCISDRYKEKQCNVRGINIDWIENYIIDRVLELPVQLEKHFVKDKRGSSIIKPKENILKKLQDRKQMAKNRLDAFIDPKLSGNLSLDFVHDKMKELNNEYELATKEIKYAIESMRTLSQYNIIITTLNNMVSKLKNNQISFEEKRNIINSVIKEIVISWDKEQMKHSIKITFTISSLIQYIMTSNAEISYLNNGWRDENKFIVNSLEITNTDQEYQKIRVVT